MLTEQTAETLQKAAGEGQGAAWITAAHGAPSRNAVIRNANRIGLSARRRVSEKQSFALMREASAQTLPDEELLEIVLFRVVPLREVSKVAKGLMERFGSFAAAIAAAPQRLIEVHGMTPTAIAEFKFLEAAVQRFTRGLARKRPLMDSWQEMLDYIRAAMAFEEREVFRVLFFDRKYGLICDEVQGVGTVDHTPVYPREVIRRALELSACSLVLAHNHPSGDPMPSTQDVKMTLDIIAIAKPLGMTVLDHVIVSRDGHASLKGMKYI